jgi:REP element-mobilizing transposase RayT
MERECIFGDIIKGTMRLNEYGKVLEHQWLRTEHVRTNIKLDEYAIMPNHFHGILIVNDNNDVRNVGARRCLALNNKTDVHKRATHRVAPTGITSGSLGAIIGQFKSAVTRQINKIRNTTSTPVWQRNYFERVIRNENELNTIREYIQNNPLQWDSDEDKPDNIGEQL